MYNFIIVLVILIASAGSQRHNRDPAVGLDSDNYDRETQEHVEESNVDSNKPNINNPQPSTTPYQPQPSMTPHQSQSSTTPHQSQHPSTESSTLGRASQDFTVSLMKELWSQDSRNNMIVSPISISTALAMTMAGAKGQTASEIMNALHFQNLVNPHNAYREEAKKYYGVEDYQLNMGNLMFVDKKFNIQRDFQTILQQNYLFEVQDPRPAGPAGDPLFIADFAGNPDNETLNINQVISEKTKGKITDLIPEGAITVDTKLVLANAIYFLGSWVRQFDLRKTRPRPFYPLSGGEKNVEMMFMTEHLNSAFIEKHNADMVELPYKGDHISMYVLVPREITGITQLQHSLLNGGDLQTMISSLYQQKVHLFLPKFKLEYGLNMVETLKSLGINAMFSDLHADFSGISNTTAVHVSGVYHQATVDVDEKGTEAAAATAILFVNRIALPAPYYVTANKPFLFFISDRRSGMVLFSGRVMDPISPVSN